MHASFSVPSRRTVACSCSSDNCGDGGLPVTCCRLGHHTCRSDATSPGLAMPMFAVPFTRSEEGNEFRHRAAERLSVSAHQSPLAQAVAIRPAALGPTRLIHPILVCAFGEHLMLLPSSLVFAFLRKVDGCLLRFAMDAGPYPGGRRRRWRDALFAGPFRQRLGRTKFAEPSRDNALRFFHRLSRKAPIHLLSFSVQEFAFMRS